MSPSAPPPMRMRAPTDAELASGPSACAVPVVPKHTEARSTAITKRIPYCYTILRRRHHLGGRRRPHGEVGSRMSRATAATAAVVPRPPSRTRAPAAAASATPCARRRIDPDRRTLCAPVLLNAFGETPEIVEVPEPECRRAAP